MNDARFQRLEDELRISIPRFQSFTCVEQAAICDAMLNAAPPTILGILPTGKGKSLCFMLPTAQWKKQNGRALTVVVSPILALMQDQVDAVSRLNAEYGEFHLKAEQLNSGVDVEGRRLVRRAVRDGEVNLLYLGPETLVQPMTYEMLADAARNGVLRALVIDEAHMISQWGDEFRTSFKRLAAVRQLLAEAMSAGEPLRTLALSATLPPKERAEVVRSLGLAESDLRTIERPEIRSEHYLRVRYAKNHDEKLALLLEDVRRLAPTGAGIIYCAQKKECEEIKDLLNEQRLGPAAHFHGGTPPAERRHLLHQFHKGTCRIMVATCAFGLGVDKRDVRWVLHFAQPQSIDAYYQEIGRGGRDGGDCEALLYYAPVDKGQAKRNALKVLRSDKFDGRWRSMKEDAVEVRHRKGETLMLVEESTVPKYVEADGPPSPQAARAHAEWNYATLVRAHELGWIELGPDVLYEVAVVKGRSAPDELAATAKTLSAAGAFQRLSPRTPVRLALGRVARERRVHPRVLQQEVFDLLLSGLVRLPDEQKHRHWDTRVVVRDLVGRHTARLGEDAERRKNKQEHGALRVDEMGSYAKSRVCRRAHFYRVYQYPAPSEPCGRCDVCDGTVSLKGELTARDVETRLSTWAGSPESAVAVSQLIADVIRAIPGFATREHWTVNLGAKLLRVIVGMPEILTFVQDGNVHVLGLRRHLDRSAQNALRRVGAKIEPTYYRSAAKTAEDAVRISFIPAWRVADVRDVILRGLVEYVRLDQSRSTPHRRSFSPAVIEYLRRGKWL